MIRHAPPSRLFVPQGTRSTSDGCALSSFLRAGERPLSPPGVRRMVETGNSTGFQVLGALFGTGADFELVELFVQGRQAVERFARRFD
jgi:hypothetical protein